jgi:hypothetical protein
MKIRTAVIGTAVLLFTALLVIGIANLTRSWRHKAIILESDRAVQGNAAPLVRINIDPTTKLSRFLDMKWQITNSEEGPIYVYSTLLKNSAYPNIQIDVDQKLIQIQWLSLDPLPFTPYAFDKAEFMRLEAKETRSGEFISSTTLGAAINDWITATVKNKKTPIEGVWKFQLLLAYGYEMESVKKAIEENDRKGVIEHPINPVVRWQKVAYSEPIEVDLQR